jgi:hypothetical protein
MRFDNIQATEIVQMPAVAKGGLVSIFNPDLMKLDSTMLKQIAATMGGELIYIKPRATYTMPESMFCTFLDCWSLAIKDHELGRCDTHVDA